MRPTHAIKWTLTSQVFRGGIQLIQLFILAKILGPSEYSLIALATAFTTLALIFSDLGLTAAYIQYQTITTEQRDALFTCNVALALIISLLAIVLAPLIARGLGTPLIEPLLKLTAPIILITALGQQVRASAEKTLNFQPLATYEIIGNAASFLTTIALALNETGAASIIWGAIVYSAIITTLPWIQFPKAMKPRLVRRLQIERKSLHFGLNTLANGILANLTLNSDLFLSSKILGDSALGSYSLPRNLTLQLQAIANPPLNRASFPILSKFQNDRITIKELFKAITSITITLNAPLYLVLIFYADPIINLALGEAWTNSIELLKVLAFWGIMRTCLNPPGTLLLALNKVESLRNWNLIVLIATCLTVLIAAPYGPTTMAQALTILTILQVALLWLTLIRRHTDVGFFEYIKSIFMPIALGWASIGGISTLNLPHDATPFHLFIQVAVSVTLYSLLVYLPLRKNLLTLGKPAT